MTEWIYRATATKADWGATVDCLTDHNFICRTAYAEQNKKSGICQLVANVRNVEPGDVIHMAFSSEYGLEGLGSFEVLSTFHPDHGGLINNASHGQLCLFRVRERSPLEEMLAATSYLRDPKLGVFTGWHVIEVERRDLVFTTDMFPGNNALHRFTTGVAAHVEIPSRSLDVNPSESFVPDRLSSHISFPTKGRFLGVDWSGAAQAGRKIWVAAILFSETDRPRLEFVRRPFLGYDAASVAAKFVNWLQSESFVAAGLDFCFGVSRNHNVDDLPRTGPVELGQWIAANYATPQDFKVALGREDKRVTDRQCRSPFAPTNLRMFRQTYWGLRALAGSILPILPWGDPEAKKVIIEILPAHVVTTLCQDCHYKGRSDVAKLERQRLLSAIVAASGLTIAVKDKQTMLDDSEGDALDALLAAITAAAVKESGYSGAEADSAPSGEGWIYSIKQ